VTNKGNGRNYLYFRFIHTIPFFLKDKFFTSNEINYFEIMLSFKLHKQKIIIVNFCNQF